MSTASSSRATHGDSSQPAPAASKKAKGKRPVEANEAMLVAQRISQLEQDAAGEKDQEAEIGTLSALREGRVVEGQLWHALAVGC